MTVITEERRAAKLELREVEISKDLTELTGIAVPYRDPADIGWFVEEHAPGSFAKSIKEAARSLPLHAFHDDVAGQGSAESWPIGYAREWVDDADNLRGVWKILDDEKSRLVSVGLVTGPAFTRATVEYVRSAERPRDLTPGQRAVDAWSSWLEEIKAGPV